MAELGLVGYCPRRARLRRHRCERRSRGRRSHRKRRIATLRGRAAGTGASGQEWRGHGRGAGAACGRAGALVSVRLERAACVGADEHGRKRCAEAADVSGAVR